jgi:hypothetical protein
MHARGLYTRKYGIFLVCKLSHKSGEEITHMRINPLHTSPVTAAYMSYKYPFESHSL